MSVCLSPRAVKRNARHELLLDLLTPVAKTYPSEMGIPSVSAGLRILGGYGYCDGDALTVEMKDTLFAD